MFDKRSVVVIYSMGYLDRVWIMGVGVLLGKGKCDGRDDDHCGVMIGFNGCEDVDWMVVRMLIGWIVVGDGTERTWWVKV